MSTVTFPGLGLTLHLNRVAFSIGTFHVYWYGIIIAPVSYTHLDVYKRQFQ